MKFALLREPLLQFIVLGAALFGAFGLFGKKETEVPVKIVVSAERQANLSEGFARTWRRQPTEEERRGLIDDYIRDEVFYREGKAAGLERDDTIIRRRVRQKMEFMVEDMASREPTEQDLAAFLASHPERFKTEDQITLRQIFLSATKRNESLETDSQKIAIVLARGNTSIDVTSLGDPFIPGDEFTAYSTSDIARVFGDDFARKITIVPRGSWQGPITSSFGQHFVLVSERVLSALPPLSEVRVAVQREWNNAQRVQALQALYDTFRARYEIEVEARTVAPDSSK